MARIRDNFQSGVLGTGLTAAATTFVSEQLAGFPVVSTGDNAVIVLDPNGEFGAPEIVYLTAHAAGADNGTILRAQEGTAARIHNINTNWINGIAASELNNFIEDNGSQGVTGSFLLTAGSATVIPFAVKAAVSQTANMSEWRNSSNTVMARINAAGALYATGVFDNSNRVYSASNPVPDNALYAHLAGAETFTGLKTFSAGATFSAGTVLIGTTTAGTLTIGNGTITKSGAAGFTFNSTIVATGAYINGYMDVFSGTAASVALSVTGAASQTANLQEWRNSANTVLSRVDAGGLIYEGANRVYSAGNTNLDSVLPAPETFGAVGAAGNSTVYAHRDHVHSMPATPVTSAVAGTGIGVSGATGAVTISNTGVLSLAVTNNATVNASTGAVTITNSMTPTFTSVSAAIARLENVNSTIVPFIIGAVTGQSANLTEWHDPANAILARISNTGALYAAGVFDGTNRVYSSVNPNLATTVNADITYGEVATVGTATAYAREDHSHGTPPTPVTSLAVVNNATVSGSTGAVTITNSMTPTFVTVSAARLALNSDTAATILLSMQRFTGQTANIAEWKDESGNLLGRIAPDGTIYVGSMAYSATGSINAAAVTIDTQQTITGQKTWSSAATNAPTAIFAKNTGQTADLTQWTDGTNGVYASVNSVGEMMASKFVARSVNTAITPGYYFLGTTNTGLYSPAAGQVGLTAGGVQRIIADSSGVHFNSNAIATVPVDIKGFAGQTGDLLQFKDSSGTILARVASDGTLYKGNQIVGGNASDTELMGIMGAY